MLTQQEANDLANLLPDGDVDLKTKLNNLNTYFDNNIISGGEADSIIEEARERVRNVLFPTPIVYNRSNITDAKIAELEVEYKVEIEFNPKTNKYDVFKNAEKVNVGDDENPVYKIIGTHVIEFESSLDIEKELIPYLNNI